MTYETYCPNCKTVSPMSKRHGATVALTCKNCRKTWGAPMLEVAQTHDPNYNPNE